MLITFSEINFAISIGDLIIVNRIHDFNDKLSIWFVNLVFIKFIVENADSKHSGFQIMTKLKDINYVLFNLYLYFYFEHSF